MPAWLIYALLAILCWGAWGVQSKLLMGYTNPYTGQVLATVGLFFPAVLALFSPKRFSGEHKQRGLTFAILTGVLGGLGNIAFYMALVGGKASIVVPLTSLSPLVTVVLAVVVLRERLKRHHYAGIALAMVAIYLLSL
jgi:transporter family protein